jgi:hypothetical protein
VGAGTATGVYFNRVRFRGVNYTGAIPFFVNAVGTAAGSLADWHFTQCRFVNPGTVQINGLLIRGFSGLEVDGCTFQNVNNSIVPQNLYQCADLRFTNNEEIYTTGANYAEGPDIAGCKGIVYTGNQQRATYSVVGTNDIGGVLIDTYTGLVTSGIVITGNNFLGNGISFSPAAAPITDVEVANNTINATQSTSGVNSGIIFGADAGTSARISVHDNTITGIYTGAPVNLGSGYVAGAVAFRNNIGYNPATVSAPGFPATTALYTNGTGVDVYAYITNGAAAMTTQVNGNTGPAIAISATQTVFIPAGGTFKATYASGSPTWVFQGN